MALAAQPLPPPPVAEPRTIETHHEDMIHDAQLDFYGRRLATCSSDRSVKVFDVVDGAPAGPGVTLVGHEGPVWQVAWAHPKFGSVLASASYDGKVLIWKHQDAPAAPTRAGGRYHNQPPSAAATATVTVAAGGSWQKIKEHAMHSASVNSLAWAPPELGAVLACASADGNVSVLTFNFNGTWAVDMVTAHPIGCNAVSWAPAVVPGSLVAPQPATGTGTGTGPATDAAAALPPVRRFASAGCDHVVRLWAFSEEQNRWIEETEPLAAHTDWVRDVAFAPGHGLPRTQLATASQDRSVIIWTQDSAAGPEWTHIALDPTGDGQGRFADTVWKVSWSVSGNVLAVCCGDGKISLWKENLKGEWECINEMDA